MPRSTHVCLLPLVVLATLAAVAFPARAATRIWPVPLGPGCNGTLQQCINDAAAGDTVRIVDDSLAPDGLTAIDELIVIDKSLTLEAAPGVDAVFAPGREIWVFSPETGPVSITLRRLVVRAGRVRITHQSSGSATYTLDQMRIDETMSGGCAIYFDDSGAGSPSFVLGDSTLRFREQRSLSPSAICAYGRGGPWQVALFRNRIESETGALFAGISITGTSSGNVTVNGNQLYSYGAARGISVSQSAGSAANVLSIHDNIVTGQVIPASTEEYALSVYPTNTDFRIVNNTIARNAKGIRILYSDADASLGRVANNIAAYNGYGVNIDPHYAIAADSHNLVFGNASGQNSAGAGTITLDPQFAGLDDFRIGATSPARDSGNNADVASVFGVAFDADGERRIADSTVDIGALEWLGDQSVRHVATGTNTDGNTTLFDTLQSLDPFETVMLTPLRGAGAAAELAQTLGVFQDFDGTGAFYAFHQDTAANLTPGRRFHALAPMHGATGFLHTTTAVSVVDAYSTISHAELDAKPGAIAFVTHNWNPGGGSGIYHDHRLGLDYFGSNWFVGNQDSADMLSGRTFNIVVAPVGSPNAFVREVGSSARSEVRLEHALLDDNACATLQVGRNGTTANNTPFAIEYRAGQLGAPGHWFIVAEGAGTPTFPANTAFNVMVSGAQANACRVTRLFSNSFE